MDRPPSSRRLTHLRLARTSAALAIAMIVASLLVGVAAWEATRLRFLDRVLRRNLDVARVLARDLADEWGAGRMPPLGDLQHYWSETDPLYEGSMQVIGPDGTVIFDTRAEDEVGRYVGDRPLPAAPGQPASLLELGRTGADWAGLRDNAEGDREAIAFANVPEHEALIAVRVPYPVVLELSWGAAAPWAGALGVVALGAGPAALYLLWRAYRLSLAETADAEAAMARYHARLRTLREVDRAVVAAGSAEAVARAGLEGLAGAVPLRAGWVCGGQDGYVVARLPADAPQVPPRDGVLRVPLCAAPGETEGVLVVEVPTADAVEPEHREILGEVADVLAVALRQARLHDEVARHADELRTRVDERTAELQEVVRELEGFNYTVAHDLRAPLRAMAGMADVVRVDEGERLAPRSVGLLAGISDSAKRLDRLVTDLLSYARIARDSAPLVPVDLDEVVRSTVDEVRRERADARFVVEGPLPVVRAIPPLLGQVLANLLGNAVKFVPPDRVPEARIRAVRLDAHRVRVEVRDNGVGVDPAHRERIFRVFERLHGSAFPGTGVGLAIVRRAVERMGGETGVEAGKPEGSVFWFTLATAE
ncbi:MAG: sensor histidine kinase, partial [Myxococcota bacterium]